VRVQGPFWMWIATLAGAIYAGYPSQCVLHKPSKPLLSNVPCLRNLAAVAAWPSQRWHRCPVTTLPLEPCP